MPARSTMLRSGATRAHLSRLQRHVPTGSPRSSRPWSRAQDPAIRERLVRARLRPARQGRARRRARSVVAASSTPTRARSCSRAAGPKPINLALRGAAESARALRAAQIVTTGIEHEAVLNTVKALERRGADGRGPSSVPERGRRMPQTWPRPSPRNRPRLGDARQQRSRHDPADRGARAPSRASTARSSTPTPCSRSARSRSRCASSASTRSRSRATSSAVRRAPARSGSVAACG